MQLRMKELDKVRDKDRDKVRDRVKVNALRDSSLMKRISLLSEDPTLLGLLIILVAK